MKMTIRLGLLIAILLSLGGYTTVSTVSAAGCGIEPIGIKPIPPVGCKDVRHECVCASNGNCYWTWVCVRS